MVLMFKSERHDHKLKRKKQKQDTPLPLKTCDMSVFLVRTWRLIWLNCSFKYTEVSQV